MAHGVLTLCSCVFHVMQACLALLLDPYTALGISAVIPLLETIDVLCVFAQQSNVFVCDMVAALKLCEGQLYSLFVDTGNGFSQDEFWSFRGLQDSSHESIHLKWVCDLNSSAEAQLAFSVAGTQHWAVHDGEPVSRFVFAQLVARVKDQCAGMFPSSRNLLHVCYVNCKSFLSKLAQYRCSSKTAAA